MGKCQNELLARVGSDSMSAPCLRTATWLTAQGGIELCGPHAKGAARFSFDLSSLPVARVVRR